MNTLMKLFTAALAAATAGLLFASCTDDLTGAEGIEEGYINISLNSRDLSRATEADVDNLNENFIGSALVCLYPNNNPGGTPAVVKYIPDLDIHSSGLVKVRLNADLQKQLFPDNASSCSAYVIANISAEEAEAVNTDTPISALQMKAILADFASKDPQLSFHMDGSTTDIRLSANGKTATGNVEMKRVASKINLSVRLAEEVTDGSGNVWTPATSGIVALISNGVDHSTFTPSAYTPAPADYFSTRYGNTATDADSQRELTRVEEQEYPYQLQQPFYTYPNRWNSDDLSRTNMTYLTLRVPWRRRGDSGYRYCYYTVPVVRGAQIGRNISYTVKINVNMLGSFTPDEPLELTDLSYYAVEWSSVNDDVELLENRYLVVDQNEFSLENLTTLSVPVYSSHDIYIKDVTLTFYRYYYNARGTEQPITITREQWQRTIDEGNGYIYKDEAHNPDAADPNYWVRFEHELVEWTPMKADGTEYPLTYPKTVLPHDDNNIAYYVLPEKPDSSYTRYVAKITISHLDLKGTAEEENYEQVLTINQYPDIYIEATENYYNTNKENGSIGTGTPKEGNMYVNGNQDMNYGKENSSFDAGNDTIWQYYWFRTVGLGQGGATNACPNQYVITVTTLKEEKDPKKRYIIGDPRVQNPTDLKGWKSIEVNTRWGTRTVEFGDTDRGDSQYATAPDMNWALAPDIETGTNRRLLNYYPTDKSEAKARWIAPKFRIASSYAVHVGKYSFYGEDQARCASYQEMSRPAGRWRIPTVAEIEFIMKLSEQGKMPALFRTGTYYMSAQGVVYTNELISLGYLTTPKYFKHNGSWGAAVRCVYDEWYWGNDTITKRNADGSIPFTWGDRAR